MLRDRGEAAEEADKKGGRVEKLFTDLESTDMRNQSGDSESTNRQGNAPNIPPSGYLFI